MNIFVTGTDTDIGKTIVSAWLCYHLRAAYWKPIEAGPENGGDAEVVSQLSGAKIYPSIYSLKAPLSPHTAAAMEGVHIDLKTISLPLTTSPLIIEGAGGVLVPLNKKETVMDLIKMLACPAIVVAKSGLGTINHTCLTLQALRAQNIPILGVIMNGPANENNRKSIEQYGECKVLAEVPFFSELKPDCIKEHMPKQNQFTAFSCRGERRSPLQDIKRIRAVAEYYSVTEI